MNKLYFLFCGLVIFTFSSIWYSSCTTDRALTNERLSQRYCGSCHHVPNPGSLTKTMWENGVMPRMADYFKWSEKSKYRYANKSFYTPSGTIPMTDTIWTSLLSHFIQGASEKPEMIDPFEFSIQTVFETRAVNNICSGRGITAVTIDPKTGEVLAACDSTLMRIGQDGSIVSEMPTGGLISGIFDINNNWIITDPGILDPHDGSYGSIKKINLKDGTIEEIQDGLARPVYLNHDKNQFYISEFGNVKGRMSKFDQNQGTIEEIAELPGSYKSFIFDYDHDGRDEILVLFAQALEGIYVKEIEAASKRFVPLLSFGPEWGISDLDTADINQDGWTDLIIANGDNADYSIMPKAYHGVNVFLNNQEGRFELSYQFPMHGATQVQTTDVDGNGFPDILVSAFFAINPADRLVVLKHKGQQNEVDFEPHVFEEASKGRWMVMNTGDIDQDGDLDAVLGSFQIAETANSNTLEEGANTDILILLNQFK